MNRKIGSDSFLALNHGLIQELGSLHAAALLAALREHRVKLLYAGKLPADGWFFFKRTRMERVLCLGHTCLTEQLKVLVDRKLVQVVRRGQNRAAYYLLNDDVHEQLARTGMAKLTGSDAELTEEQEDEVGLTVLRSTGQPQSGPRSNNIASNNDLKPPTEVSRAPGGAPAQQHVSPGKPRPVLLLPDKYASTAPDVKLRPLPKPVKVPASLQPVVDRWGELAVRHGESTQALRRGVAALRAVVNGTFFLDKPTALKAAARPYSVSEVLIALERFGLKRNDVDYLPLDKTFLKRCTLADFFYSRFAVGDGGTSGSSLFLECLTTAPAPAAARFPELTEYVAVKYEEVTAKLLPDQAAARVANKLMSYWGEREPWLRARGISSPKRLTAAWFKMLDDRYGVKWDVGNVLAASMNAIFESHLKQG